MNIEILESKGKVLGLVKVTQKNGIEVQDKRALYYRIFSSWIMFRSFTNFREIEALKEFIEYFNKILPYKMELQKREDPFYLEGANSTELVLTEIELREFEGGNTHDVYFCPELDIFYAINPKNLSDKPILYKLNVLLEDLSLDKVREILEYRLGTYSDVSEITLGDVFMHGEFITKL